MNKLKVEIFGESHAEKIGVILGGIPVGSSIDTLKIDEMLARRGASNTPWSTPRKEKDEVVFLRGIENGKVSGEIEAVIYNKNTRPQDYTNVKVVPRPSHADFVSYVKYGVIPSGGGKWSGRMTAPLCIAGAVAKDLLERENIKIGAYISSIGSINGKSYKNSQISVEEIEACHKELLPTLSNSQEMTSEVMEAKANGDSIGGTIECIVYGLPIGLGDNLFEGMESAISHSVFAVPGVKGIEFGSGFDITKMNGSIANDGFAVEGNKVITLTNNSGGINGGLTNGMPLTLRVALRPTPSIAVEQDSVNLATMTNEKVVVKGRHDSCIVPRAVAAIESAVAIAIYDKYLEYKGE